VLEIVASVAAAAIETAQLARDAQTAAIVHAVGDLSHDIKNKVSPIVIGIQALRSDLDAMFAGDDAPSAGAGTLSKTAAAVRDSYGYTFDIVMDQVEAIQEYAKLLADALKGVVTEPELEPNDPAVIVEGQLLALDAVARHRGVALHRRFGTIPICRFDRFQVERAAYNLVDNAIAATPRGGYVTVAIAVREEERFAGGRALELVVSDTGSGMAPHVLARILRGEPKSTKPGGTGLGTRIVFNAVAAHRGIFDGTSTEGSGTRFRMVLPLVTD
jgi:signal transduction histidine kinase